MPFDVLIQPERKLLTLRIHGVVSEKDIDNLYRTLERSPDFNPAFDQLVEIAQDVATALDATELQRAAHLDPFSKQSRRAFAVMSPLAYGMLRMWMAYTEDDPDRIGLFKSTEEAVAWLASLP